MIHATLSEDKGKVVSHQRRMQKLSTLATKRGHIFGTFSILSDSQVSCAAATGLSNSVLV